MADNPSGREDETKSNLSQVSKKSTAVKISTPMYRAEMLVRQFLHFPRSMSQAIMGILQYQGMGWLHDGQ